MRRLLILFFAMGLLSCKTASSELSAGNQKMSPEFNEIWQRYVEFETRGRILQPDCRPRIIAASPAVPHAGIVFYFHGFTACPQQYFDMAEKLSAKGYDVVLPLIPGHGRLPIGGMDGDKDDLADLPTLETEASSNPLYPKFIKTMNQLAQISSGDKILVGLSGGGGLATRAAIDGQNIWTRVLLHAPWFKPSGPGAALLVGGAGALVPNFLTGFGGDCIKNRQRAGGRNGICTFKVTSAVANLNVGQKALKEIDKIKIPVQFTGVEGDRQADNGAIEEAFTKVKSAQLCLFPKGVPHSMVNPKVEEPETAPFTWLAALQKQSVDFITEGVWFKTIGAKKVANCQSTL